MRSAHAIGALISSKLATEADRNRCQNRHRRQHASDHCLTFRHLPLQSAEMFFVYMVRCADGSLYTGYARDPRARAKVHNAGKGAAYTRSRLPVSLIYSERCQSLSAALKREHQLKTWTKLRKEALVARKALIARPDQRPPRLRQSAEAFAKAEGRARVRRRD